jgi:hypothetical protein
LCLKFFGDVKQIGPANILSILKTLIPEGVSIASLWAVKLTSDSAKSGSKHLLVANFTVKAISLSVVGI